MNSAYENARRRLRSGPRRWLVTGAAGFIGSNIVQSLLELGQTVIGLDNFATGHRRNLAEVRTAVGEERWLRFDMMEADICDAQACREAVRAVDFVLHQAAMGSVPRSLAEPLTANAVNIGGFLNMLTAAKDAGIESFVYAGSSSTYGDQRRLPNVEDSIGAPLSPYAVTKRVNELYADVFSRCYGFGTVGLRYFNVFGPRHDPEGAYARVIPKWALSMIEGEDVIINGDGETSRDFCYVENAVQANVLAALAQDSARGRVFNVGVGSGTTLNGLFSLLQEELARCHVHYDRAPIHREERAGDIRHLQADISRAERLLGYRPTHDLRQGLRAAIPWFLEYSRRNRSAGKRGKTGS
jgi:UDP-N-acetylglucosamine 4-epimerase